MFPRNNCHNWEKRKNGKVRTSTQLEYVDIIYYNKHKKKTRTYMLKLNEWEFSTHIFPYIDFPHLT